MSKQTSRSAGFTLIELLIAIMVMSLLSTIVLLNYRSADRTRRVQLAADMVVSALTDAQNLALSGKGGSGCINGNNTTINPYVVTINYGLQDISLHCGTTVFRTYTLPAGTQIQSSGLSIDGTTTNQIYFYYYPPFANIKACATSCSDTTGAIFTSAALTLESNQGAATSRTVTVDGLTGRIK